MGNKKRDRNGYKRQLGRHKLSYSDLLAIEKLLWIYADAREMRFAEVSELPEGRDHMPRAAVDRHISMGRFRPFYMTFGWNEYSIYYPGVDWIYREDSVKFLKERGYPRRTRYIEILAWPGIKVTIRPFSTEIYAQTHYATGKELMAMRDVVRRIEEYILRLKPARFNSVRIDR